LNFRHGERGVFGANAARALANIDQAILIAIDERTKQHPANYAKDGGVCADAERQRQHNRERKSLGARQRTNREFHVAQEGRNGLAEPRMICVAFAHNDCSLIFVVSSPRRSCGKHLPIPNQALLR
jgi:hypothetical protein